MVSMKEIQSAARRIGEEFHPERVILFGSYARAEATADSDVDLLVIMPFEGPAAIKAAEVLLRIDPKVPADVLVRTPQMVRRRLAMGDCFMREIIEKGKVLYAGESAGKALARDARLRCRRFRRAARESMGLPPG